MVDGVDVIGGVGDQEVSNGKGKYPRQDEGDVVADEVEKCGAGCAGNGMVVFRVVHVVVFFLVYEAMRLGDVRLRDFRLRDFRPEVCETEKIPLLSDVFKSFSLLAS